jgi:glycine dehydrogenase subunit 1
MPYCPHTEQETQLMLDAIGVDKVDSLFSEIASKLKSADISSLDIGMDEIEITRELRHAAPIKNNLCYIGAGAYEHNIPAIVWELLSRGELLTAYTPYQAEASQGTLNLIFQFQTLMSKLTAMSFCNASVYDAATALSEAILMAARSSKSDIANIAIPRNIHPHYRQTINTILKAQPVNLIEIDFDKNTGLVDQKQLDNIENIDALVIAQPNFFGCCEDVNNLTNWVHSKGGLMIASINPMSLGKLKAPGNWGEKGADIVCGDAQPFGIPLSYGGPYCGFLCCNQPLLRQLPGRLVGKTVDAKNNTAYTLTLQAREQHIRRAKARSNICTNQGLLMSAAVISLRYWGAAGIQKIVDKAHANASWLQKRLQDLPGVTQVFSSPFLYEFAIRLDCDAANINKSMLDYSISAGYSICRHYPNLGNVLLICVTETKTNRDLNDFVQAMRSCLQREVGC